MERIYCKDCENYRQHYALNERKIFRVYCGHCVLYVRKRKKPDTPACEHFVPAMSGEEAFVDKEYLSKELLRYVLSLDLLPEIKDKLD